MAPAAKTPEPRLHVSFTHRPDRPLRIPRRRPHGCEARPISGAEAFPFRSNRRRPDSIPAAEVHTSIGSSANGQARVMTVIRSIPPDDSASRADPDDGDTPLAYFLPIRQYALLAAARQVGIVEPLLNIGPGRMGRVNQRPVRITRSSSVCSQKAQISTEDEVQSRTEATAPIPSPDGVKERCEASVVALESAPEPALQTETQADETCEEPASDESNPSSMPARYRRGRRQKPRAAGETANGCTTLADIVLDAGWSNALLELLNHIGTNWEQS